ncbi:MAG: FAD-dependent oxidoreductase [Desulfurococcales archaeon]|nr:FAD-dependent oxidoreductase [Desulfurococcales archaeon]
MFKQRRISKHPVLRFKRGKEVTIFFEGKPLKAFEGESLAAALYAAGVDVFRWTPKLGRPRGPFCMVGKCGSCMVEVDGEVVRACITPVKEGMKVRRIKGLPPINAREAPDAALNPSPLEVDVLIVGGGPAGMAASEILAKEGMSVLLVDDQPRLGGQLIKQTHIFFGSQELFAGKRGFRIAEEYEKKLMSLSNLQVMLRTTALGVFEEGILITNPEKGARLVRPKYVVISTGAFENYLLFENNDLPGVMGAGGAQTLMNLYGVLPGKEVVVIGSGNVGLIITYQLLQAGAGVKAIIEAAPKIGGWLVHAAKIRRFGVPIITKHTIIAAEGRDRVEAAVIAEVNEKWEPIPGTEKRIECDTILLAVGLTPNSELLRQFGVTTKYVPELGGLVPVRNRYMETNVDGVFVAGDVSGVEEATTAFIEGWIVAYSILLKENPGNKEWLQERERLVMMVEEYRSSPVSSKVRSGLRYVEVG